MKRRCVPVAELRALAADETVTWRVWRRRGDTMHDYKIVTASSEKEALRKGGKFATTATPVLSSTGWQALYEEHGRPCIKTQRRR